MRRLRLIVIIVSAALFAVAIAAWGRSHELGEVIGREGRDEQGKVTCIDGLFSGGGQLAVGRLQVQHPHRNGGANPLNPATQWFEKPVARTVWCWRRDFIPYPFLSDTAHGWLTRLGFGRRGLRAGSITRHAFTGLGVPYWLVALATGLAPALLLGQSLVRAIRRAERARLGQCLHCGYDLRGSGARCPECGHELPSARPRM